jgi:hypothetical protein
MFEVSLFRGLFAEYDISCSRSDCR